jgi:beta-N-acetylhexosaminidase
VGLAALLQAVAALLATNPSPPALAALTPREKAALVVVSGLPAAHGIGGVIVRGSAVGAPRRALVFADQEGGLASTFDSLPPAVPPSAYASAREAFRAGRVTGRALHRAGVDVDLAPVLDLRGGPLGSRHFASAKFALAFADGLRAGRTAACVKHFPGLGSAPLSTDESPHVHARLARRELAAFRRAVKRGISCVMVGHAFYPRLGKRRASFNPAAYRMLRRHGFDGVAITDSLSVFGSDNAVFAARSAARAGADLLLFTNGRDARRAIRALIPFARRGMLDDNVRRVLAFRRGSGLGPKARW